MTDPRNVRPTGSGGGDGIVWSALSTLLAGPLVWGLAGWGLGAWLSARWLLPVGIVVGFAASLYIVYAKYGRG